MKKLLLFSLILLLLLGIVGCGSTGSQADTYTVYYRRAVPTYGSTDSIIGENHLLTSGRESDTAYLLRKYLASTPENGFVSPFSQDITLVSFQQDGPTVKVVLSNQIAELSGMDLTIALACLTRTIVSLTDCQEVIISANTAQLNGQNYITLSRDSYLLIDNSVQPKK